MTFTEFIKKYTPDYKEREREFIRSGLPKSIPVSRLLKTFRDRLFPEALETYTSEVIAEARRVKYNIPDQETIVTEGKSHEYVEFAHNEWASIHEIREKCDCKKLTKAGFTPIEKVTRKESSAQIDWSKFRIPRVHAPGK